jgi:hypothetical protein
MKEGQYYYKPHHRMWAVWQNHNIGNSSSVGTLIKDNLTRDEAREEVYRLNGWCNQKK